MPDKHEIACFDIFDTLLTRKVADPTSVFFLTAQQALNENLIKCSPEIYVAIRRQAEQLSRKEAGDGQIHFLRIFDYLAEILSINQTQSHQLLAIELEWEKKLLFAIPGANKMVEQERANGKHIIYVSDMYWSADILKDFLSNAGIFKEGDEIWVSSEHGASKDTGRLFDKLLAAKPLVNRSTTTHFGNDYYIDYKGARKAGLQAVLLEKGNANRYELLLDSFRQHTNGFSAILSGTGRMFRLKHSLIKDKKSEIARIIANVAGPSMLMYVIWILNEAQRHQLERLCFISRDGYIPYLIAKKIAPYYGSMVDIQYLYGSRQAWHLPGITEINTHTFSWLFDQRTTSTCRNIFKRIELQWEEISQLAPELASTVQNPDIPLSIQQVDALKTALTNNTSLNQFILEKAKVKRALILDYLIENNLFPDRKTGMIEIGWRGKTRTSFDNIVGNDASKNLHWLYLGLAHDLPIKNLSNFSTFLYGPLLNYAEVNALPQIVESFCFANHGSVLGFSNVNGKISPVFNSSGEEAYDAWGRQTYLELFEDYINDLPIDLFAHLECGNLRFPTHELLKLFCEHPDKQDAEIWETCHLYTNKKVDRSTNWHLYLKSPG